MNNKDESDASEKKHLSGKDWSRLENDKKEYEEYLGKNENENENEKYFKNYYEFPRDEEHSPFNLGIYYKTKDKILSSSQYVGIMPLKPFEKSENNLEESSNCYCKIKSRFGMSATDMLEYILKSDDIYSLEDVINLKEFTMEELKECRNTKENKILFGIVKDLEEVQAENEKWEISLIEIWDFISKAKVVCQRMLKNQFQRVEENFIGKVKGKIDLQKQIKMNLSQGRLERNYCSYNKLIIDNIENRILKYSLHLCKKFLNEIGKEIDVLSEQIAYCDRALSSVKLVKCSSLDFIGLKNNGVFKHYKPAIESAKRIIKRITIKIDEDEKVELSSKTRPFFIDMNLLFELYCRALVKETLKDYSHEFELVEYGKPHYIFEKKEKKEEEVKGFSRSLIPDIVIKEKEKYSAVIDAKYSSLEDGYNREKTHQIMAYMTLLDCNYGGFISPESEETYELRNMEIGNKKGFHIGVKGKKTDEKGFNENVEKIKKLIEEIKNGGDKNE